MTETPETLKVPYFWKGDDLHIMLPPFLSHEQRKQVWEFIQEEKKRHDAEKG